MFSLKKQLDILGLGTQSCLSALSLSFSISLSHTHTHLLSISFVSYTHCGRETNPFFYPVLLQNIFLLFQVCVSLYTSSIVYGLSSSFEPKKLKKLRHIFFSSFLSCIFLFLF